MSSLSGKAPYSVARTTRRTRRPCCVATGRATGRGVRKRKVVPPEAVAAPEAAYSSASEEEDSSVSDDFQP